MLIMVDKPLLPLYKLRLKVFTLLQFQLKEEESIRINLAVDRQNTIEKTVEL